MKIPEPTPEEIRRNNTRVEAACKVIAHALDDNDIGEAAGVVAMTRLIAASLAERFDTPEQMGPAIAAACMNITTLAGQFLAKKGAKQ